MNCKDCKWFEIPEKHFYVSNEDIDETINRIVEAYFGYAEIKGMEYKPAEFAQVAINKQLERAEKEMQDYQKEHPNFGGCINEEIWEKLISLETLDPDPYEGVDVYVHGSFGCIGFKRREE